MAEPTGQFLRLLAAAITSGRAYLAAPVGGRPKEPAPWGWREQSGQWLPQGRRVGWVDGDAVLLEPGASYAAAQEMAAVQGESLTVSAPTLWRRLKERGLLASWDRKRERNTIRKKLEGVRREVLHLRAVSLFDR